MSGLSDTLAKIREACKEKCRRHHASLAARSRPTRCTQRGHVPYCEKCFANETAGMARRRRRRVEDYLARNRARTVEKVKAHIAEPWED